MRAAAALLVLPLLLVACGDDAGVGAGDALTGRTFVSQEVTGHELVPGTSIQLTFHDDGRLTANAGCNTMGGTVTYEGDRLRTDEVSMTEMGCDPERHDQDRWLADLLAAGPTFAVEGDTLRLVDGEVEVTMLDREVADPDRPLEGTEWRLESIVEGDAASSAPPATVRFDGGTATVAVERCNQGSTTYEVDGDHLVLGDITSTLVACEEPMASAEQALHHALTGRIAFEVDGPTLRLRAEDGRGVDLRAAPEE